VTTGDTTGQEKTITAAAATQANNASNTQSIHLINSEAQHSIDPSIHFSTQILPSFTSLQAAAELVSTTRIIDCISCHHITLRLLIPLAFSPLC
jgi:hypothetical protein